jgi:hypothetical protein
MVLIVIDGWTAQVALLLMLQEFCLYMFQMILSAFRYFFNLRSIFVREINDVTTTVITVFICVCQYE